MSKVVEDFQKELLQKLQAKVKELNLYDKETYTQEEFGVGSALINAFTVLEDKYKQYQESIEFCEEILEFL